MGSRRFDTLAVGAIIQYVLLPSQQPTNPQKVWRGRVERVTKSTSNGGVGICRIQSTEPGYEGLEEYVYSVQIVYIEGQ